MNSIYFLMSVLALGTIGCQTKSAEQGAETAADSISAQVEVEVPANNDDRALFNLQGPVKSMSQQDLDTEEEAGFSEYNFNEEGRIVDGVDQGFSFTVDYSGNPAGVYTKISEYEGMDDQVIELKRNEHGLIINWGEWNDGPMHKPVVNVLKRDRYGNPLVCETSGNDGHDYPEPDSGNYTEKTVYEYEYDGCGNWTMCKETTDRHYLKPQTTWLGEPTEQDEHMQRRIQRKYVYFNEK